MRLDSGPQYEHYGRLDTPTGTHVTPKVPLGELHKFCGCAQFSIFAVHTICYLGYRIGLFNLSMLHLLNVRVTAFRIWPQAPARTNFDTTISRPHP